MTSNVTKFLDQYRNSIVTTKTTIDMFSDQLTSIEVDLLSQQLNSLSDSVNSLLTLTSDASEEHLDTYKDTIKTLDNKISYIDNVSNMLMYINSYYDMNNTVDIKNIDILKPSLNSSLVFNAENSGLTLNHSSSSYNCPKAISNNKVTFYNTNLAYHSGICISSPFMDVLDIKSIVIRKNNGDVVQLSYDSLMVGKNYLKHDLLSSIQIDIEFNNTNYIDTLSLNLIDYKFILDGSVDLPPILYNCGKLFNFIYSCTVPDKCFIINETTIELLDINMNTVDKIDLLLPVGKTLVCKCLYDVDFSLVGDVVGVYINNMFSNRSSQLTNEYLNSIQDKKEVYVVFNPKIKDTDKETNNLELINNQGFIINNKNTKLLRISSRIEFHSFNPSESPTIKAITGVTKNNE